MKKRAWLGIAFATAATPVLAQMGGGRRGNRGGKSSEEPGKGGAQEPQADMLEVTLHEFHEDLKLSAAQEPAWESYADKAVDAARNRLTALEDIAQAAKALYAGLSADQQRVADPRLANIMSIPLTASVPARK